MQDWAVGVLPCCSLVSFLRVLHFHSTSATHKTHSALTLLVGRRERLQACQRNCVSLVVRGNLTQHNARVLFYITAMHFHHILLQQTLIQDVLTFRYWLTGTQVVKETGRYNKCAWRAKNSPKGPILQCNRNLFLEPDLDPDHHPDLIIQI